ncbi:MAG: hypothetical protein IT208_14520 [Chthonomonadales bacterium]|nr:hypothetical protein [Chthonomonadales bacterium]
MGTSARRIACPRCGANNFETVTQCWKCSAPLGAAPEPVRGSAPAPAQPFSPNPRHATPAGLANDAARAPGWAAVPAGNPGAANRAAVWLGLLFPYFGLPIGLAFVMCDDRRRQEVGRVCILWSLVSTAVHLLLLAATVLGMRELLAAVLQGVRGGTGQPALPGLPGAGQPY